MNISGQTKVFAVLGHPIRHSLSPAMHNASLRALGLDAVYTAFDVRPDRLMRVLPAMADMGFGGVNLTAPLKEAAFAGLKDLDDSARRLGAVNTVEFRPDGIKGHNTDDRGFLTAIEEAFAIAPAGRSIFVLGCGGAGRAVALACAIRGARRLLLADLREERAGRLADEIRALAPAVEIVPLPPDPAQWTASCPEAELVVQATPVGMKRDDASLLASAAFRSEHRVLDLVYPYSETAFMKAARQAGARTANGLSMLLHQGAYAFTIWTGKQADVTAMRTALEKAVCERME
ncbi:MAG: shikimate dehydrogenase [Verrucomicrobiota bacterium]|nr:shikimate dehydrogenase [Verrucomicrobiota bacterium]